MPADDRYSSATFGSQPTITRTVTKQVVPFTSNELVDPDVVVTKKHEEWTTSKRVVNHKTKQVETRVQRQLILEDGRVVADSGPQVTTKTKEDVRVEESENSQHKTTGDDAPGPGYSLVPGSAQVVSEKTESTQTMTETKEENRQMHDENIRDLSGEELHQRIIVAPDDTDFANGQFPGTLTHFSSRSQKVVDKEEVKEVSQLKDGELSTETTRTHHHEEAYDDEVPEEEAEEGMVPERSAETSRKIQYYTDPREFESVANQLRQESCRSKAELHHMPRNDSTSEVPAVTHKWLDDHFGSSETGLSDHRENTRTRSGGNRITIEMSGNRSSPTDLSPTENGRKHDTSRESTLRHRSSFERSAWPKTYNERSPSPQYPSSTLTRSNVGRTTTSPFELSSSSGSSRSKTPVKTFYLGEDNTYTREQKNGVKKVNKKPLAEILKSSLSIGESNSYGRSDYDVQRSDSMYKSSSLRNRTHDTQPRNDVFHTGPIYSNIKRHKTNKNIQVSMSDEDDDVDHFKMNRRYRERSLSPHHRLDNRSATTLPRNLKPKQQFKTLHSPMSTKSSKHYKSSESLLSPNHSNYSSILDYGSTNSFKYSDHRGSPTYNHSPSATSTLKATRNNGNYHKDDWINSSYNDTYSTNRSNRNSEYRVDKNNSYRHEEMRNSYEMSNGRKNDSSKLGWNSSGFSPHFGKNKTLISPPESGYQSPLPPTPPSSPPPRLIKVLNSDPYGSSSSMSPPDSPLHPVNSASIRRSSAYPCGGTSRSKSSGDLRSSRLLPSPTSFSPLASPLELKTVGEKNDRQKYFRVKPGQDGHSVVVQVREWDGR